MDVNNYIAGLVKVPTGVKNLGDLITFNIDHASEELIPPFYTDQSQWVLSCLVVQRGYDCLIVQVYRIGSEYSQCFVL